MTEERLHIHVKTNRPKTEILSQENGKIELAVHAPPIDNKANIEIIKFFTKKTKRNVRIITGLKSKEKIIGIS
jgi:uncharacterized protein